MRYISLGVDLSEDGDSWQDCCSEEGARTNFYADDKSGEVDVVRTHPFNTVMVARYVRIRISTGLRWIGHDDKCFRFEILGCSSQSQADTELTAVAQAPGYIGVTWSPPVVSIPPMATSAPLHASYYLLNVTMAGQETRLFNTSDTSVNVARPMWGAVYTLSLTCWVHMVPVRCGQYQLRAEPVPSAACRAHSSFCSRDKVRFLSPQHLTATLLTSSLSSSSGASVSISWSDSNSGQCTVIIHPPHLCQTIYS